MTLSLSAQQIAFYAKNGFLELEELFTPSDCDKHLSLILETLASRRLSMKMATDFIRGRDLWRDTAGLKTLLFSRKLSNLALDASGKQLLRLACDQWFEPDYFLEKPEKLKDLLSIQGLVCTMFIQFGTLNAELPTKMSPLGLAPFPHGQGNVQLISPTLLLNWPKLHPGVGLYLVAYAIPSSVYVQNPRDPAGVLLRQYGYGYGDPLRNDTHPLLLKS